MAVKKGTLRPEQIIDAALGQVEAEGLESLSTRKLGAALGVEAMSLYHHFPSKGHLLDAVADRLAALVVIPDEPRSDPLERLRQAIGGYRAVAQAYPQAFPLLAIRRFNTPTALTLLEGLLGLYRELGLSPERAARWFRMMGYFLNGALLSERTIRGKNPDHTGSTVDSGVPVSLPTVAECAPFLGVDYLDATFDEGLERFLTQLAQEVG